MRVGGRWQRRGLAMSFLMGGLLMLWYGLARQTRGDLAPGLRASTQEDTDSRVGHPDFRGDWKLDLDASDSVAPLLRALGKPEWAILLASRMSATHILRGDRDHLTLEIQTTVRNQKQELLLDGTPTPAIGPDGGETLASTRWSEDGQSLITITQPSSQQPLSFRITRSLAADRRSMLLDIECRGQDGNPLRVRRVFRLVALPE